MTDAYVRCAGVAQLSYAADATSPIAGGDSTQALESEMAAPNALRHDARGLVSLVVKEEREREVTERLVAMGGKLVTVREVAGEAPNGSAFAITLGPAPELDRTNLVVGRVVGGMDDVVARLAALPRSKPRDDWFDKVCSLAGVLLVLRVLTMSRHTAAAALLPNFSLLSPLPPPTPTPPSTSSQSNTNTNAAVLRDRQGDRRQARARRREGHRAAVQARDRCGGGRAVVFCVYILTPPALSCFSRLPALCFL